MSNNDSKYVERVRDNTRRYIEELLQENERLRGALGTVQATHHALADQVLELRQELERRQAEQGLLRTTLDSVEAENRRFAEQYLEVERQNNDLATLYAASYGLHDSVDRGQVLETVQEIVRNLIGSEELAIFLLDQPQAALDLVSWFGVDPAPITRVELGEGAIGSSARSGELYLPERAMPREPTACIPLKVAGRVIGVIAIFRLLPHKSALLAVDRELFGLLATHAATALYCAELHASFGTGPAVP